MSKKRNSPRSIPALPRYDRNFEPWGHWLMRPVWWRGVKNHVIIGDPAAGKTTLLYHGLRELAECSFYLQDDLKKLTPVRKTKKPFRLSLRQTSFGRKVNSWIDVDGESFLKSFKLDKNDEDGSKNKEALSKIYARVNSMVVILPAQQLLDIDRHRKSASKRETAFNYTDNFQERIHAFRPTLRRQIWRTGFQWHFLVSQSGGLSAADLAKLHDAVTYFAQTTGLDNICKHAILVDSKTEPLIKRGQLVAELEALARGKYYTTDNGAPICSAGVAMAEILNLSCCDEYESEFLFPLNQ